MSKLTKEITQLIINEDKDGYYKYHIALVVHYAIKLAHIEKEDEEAIELAALLHDIGRIRYGGSNHNITGEKDAREILKQYNYDLEKNEKICSAIISHGGEDEFPINDLFGEIIRSADGLSHLDIVPYLLALYLKKKDLGGAIKKLIEKLEFEWTKKITLQSAKMMGKAKHDSAILVLRNNLDIINQRE